MASSKSRSRPRAPRAGSAKTATATLRSVSGAGFEFEDLISAGQLVKALSGQHAPGIGSVVTQVQAQVSTLGWRIDDLLLTAQGAGALRRLAISAKGNVQVTAAGLPADFVKRAWEQWRDPDGPFNRATDGLVLVTLGTHQAFDPAWREVKNACSGTDMALAMSRIRSNTRQSSRLRQRPEARRRVRRRDHRTHSPPARAADRLAVRALRERDPGYRADAVAIARVWPRRRSAGSLEASSSTSRKRCAFSSGTITVSDLLSLLRGPFGLRHHPDFERDWETLSNITADHKARIETEFPSGYAVSADSGKGVAPGSGRRTTRSR